MAAAPGRRHSISTQEPRPGSQRRPRPQSRRSRGPTGPPGVGRTPWQGHTAARRPKPGLQGALEQVMSSSHRAGCPAHHSHETRQGERWALWVFGNQAAGGGERTRRARTHLVKGRPRPRARTHSRRGGPCPRARTHSTRGAPRPRARTHSTRAQRAQATAPQLQQERTQRAHRARSHWPHAAFPSTARTHDEQAPDAAPAGSASEACA